MGEGGDQAAAKKKEGGRGGGSGGGRGRRERLGGGGAAVEEVPKALPRPRWGQELGNLGLRPVPVRGEDDMGGGELLPHRPGPRQIPRGKEGRVEGAHRGARHGGHGRLQPQIPQGLPHADLIGALPAAARQYQP